MSILSPEQLTGRSRTHVQEQVEPRCILHPQALQAFQDMRRAAAAAGIDLVASSSFRDFQHQLTIWNGKYRGQRPVLDPHGIALDIAQLSPEALVRAMLHWSALPGASRHHWGSDLDLIDQAALPPGQRPQLVPAEYVRGGVFERLNDWLGRHAGEFDFFLPYDRDRGGVQPEPWHFSYAPVSGSALPALTLEVLRQALETADLAGGEVVRQLLAEIHQRYVCAVASPPAQRP